MTTLCFVGTVLGIFIGAMAFAQIASTGQMSGKVTDSTGAVLPGVEVTVTRTTTGFTRTAVSNETGRASGGSVTSLTKSGTNEYHGDAFWFVRNAVFWNLDMALSRKFTLGETQRFEVRIEAFNATNSVRPYNIAYRLTNTSLTSENNLTSGQFGRVTRIQPARVMQFALKYVF